MRRVRFDHLGTVLLSLSLAAYALAMTLGGGHFGSINMVLVAMAATGVGLFLAAESRAASPLVRVEMLRRHGLGAGLAMSTLVTTVVMATLVVGPFYLSRALGLGTAVVGLVLSIGPLVSALTGIPAGSAVDRFGARRIAVVGLGGMGIGALLLALLPLSAGLVGYIPCIAVITSGYALFQAANNTVIMSSANADHRGVVAGMLSLSRNLGLITGASAMAAVFALGAGGSGIMAARPADVSAGMRLTLAVAAALVITALAIASAGIRLTRWSESPASTSSLAKDGC